MKRFVFLVAVLGVLATSGCVIREVHRGDWDRHSHDYGYEEHWDRDHYHWER